MMNPLQKLNNRGFSVTEMMVTIAISSVIAYSIFAVMRAGETQVQGAQVKMTIQDSAREGLYKMAQEIRLSTAPTIQVLNGGNTIQFQVPNPLAPTNPDFTVNWAGANLIQYSLGGANGAQLIRTNLTTGQTTVLANDVTGVLFNQNGDLVTITINVQRAMINGRLVPANPLQMTAQARLRNI